jgi:hypothetical protein
MAYCDGLLDLALAHVDLAEHQVHVEILRRDLHDAQALFDSRRQQPVSHVVLDIAHGGRDLRALRLGQRADACAHAADAAAQVVDEL